MPMNKTRILLGASVIMLTVASGGAEARKVYYEINGTRYSYDTNDRGETAQAKKRIEAAKAAATAKAKAEEEKSKYPLVTTFTSATQREAKAAQERLEEVLSEKAVAAKPQQSSPERRAKLRDRRQNDKKDDKESKVVSVIVPRPAANVPLPPTPPPQILPIIPPPPIAGPVSTPHPAKVRSVSFDVETGIKTTIMVDGAIEEEPFDSSVLAHLAPEQGRANSLMAFVKQLRKVASDETTGSVVTGAAQPAP